MHRCRRPLEGHWNREGKREGINREGKREGKRVEINIVRRKTGRAR